MGVILGRYGNGGDMYLGNKGLRVEAEGKHCGVCFREASFSNCVQA